MVVTEVKQLLQENIPAAQVMVDSEDNVHFQATIITDAFLNKKTIERQRMIYAIVGDRITNGAIHALTLKTFTQQEWRKQCDN